MVADSIERKFNPAQLRDDHGKWTDGTPGSAIDDALKLAGRIDLDKRESLISSSRITDTANGGDVDMNFAVVRGPGEDEVRIGLIPHHDSDRWRAADKGGTAVLNEDQVRHLRSELSAAVKAAKKATVDANKAWDSGHAPTDPVLLGTDPVHQGTLSTDWADLSWAAYVTDGDGNSNSWELTIEADSASDGIKLGPKDAGKLLNHLGDIEGQLNAAETSRAYSPESGPTYQPPPGPSQGGQFAKGGGRVAGKGRHHGQRRQGGGAAAHAAPPGPLHFDGKSGTGYGIKGGDPRVRTLQAAINRLGVTDSHGQELDVDGRYGPLTTSAVKKLQKALGLPVTGQVTPEFLAQVSNLQQLPPKPPRKRAAKRKARATPRQHIPRRRRVHRSDVLALVAKALGEHVMLNGKCVICDPDDDADEPDGDPDDQQTGSH